MTGSPLVPTVQIAAGSVPEGKIADFLTGRHVRDTPEEYVRQNLEKALVRQYGFAAQDCEPEFPIRVGSSRKRVDIAVFESGKPHTQENIAVIVETKRAGTNASGTGNGVRQLQSYMAASLNARYGIWTNGDEKYSFAKRIDADGSFLFEEIIDVPASASPRRTPSDRDVGT
jgi:type I restriction enzyme M protein